MSEASKLTDLKGNRHWKTVDAVIADLSDDAFFLAVMLPILLHGPRTSVNRKNSAACLTLNCNMLFAGIVSEDTSQTTSRRRPEMTVTQNKLWFLLPYLTTNKSE